MKVVAASLSAILLAGVALLMCLPRAKPRPPETLAALAPELSVAFPRSTRLIGVLRQNGMDDWIGTKVTISREDWPAFLASTTLDESRLESGENGLLGPDQGFWDPNRHADLRTGQAVLEKQFRALNIGVADLGKPIVIVYIVNHGS